MTTGPSPIDPVEDEPLVLEEQALDEDDVVYECGLGSFPASDPPSWWAAGQHGR